MNNNYRNRKQILRTQLGDAHEDFDEIAYWDEEFQADLLQEARYFPVDSEKLREVGDIFIDREKQEWSTTIDDEEIGGRYYAGSLFYYTYEFPSDQPLVFKRFLESYPHI